jgi:Carboxypeptidase regulatory-like domain/TonB-dependent Receptor Plug Domain
MSETAGKGRRIKATELHIRRGWARLLAALLLMLLTSGAARAQYDTGDVVGVIEDASGAVVAGARITVVNKDTGAVFKTSSGPAGEYEVPSLHTGNYKITAEHAGFSTAVADNIAVAVGARQRIDLTLKVGQNATTVEVSDVTLELQTESSQRDQTITGYQTEALPLVSRNYSDLVDYVSGSRPDPSQANQTGVTSLLRQGSYSVNGQRSMFNDYLIDGMDNNAYGESNQGFDNQIIQPPPDSIAQFDVVTNNESAEYGRASGATINVATKSGTNQFHTTLYEFLRNTDLNATGYFAPVKKPSFNRNQFGADFGGPILKNRLFYFLDYEGFRQTLTPLDVLTVPTLNELNGNLAVAVQDPWSPGTYVRSGTPFTSWPSQALADLDPASKVIAADYQNALKGLPAACTVLAGTGTGGSAGEAASDCPTNAPFTDNADKGDLRLDFQQSPNTSWFVKVSDRKETGDNFPTLPEPIDGQANGEILIHDEQLALGFNHAVSSTQFVDARLALSGTRAGKWSKSIGSSYNFSSLIPGLPTISDVSGGLPSISVSGGFSAFGRQSTNPQWQNPSLIDPKVNYSWVKGKHSLKFGFEYEHILQQIEDSNPLYGSFAFSAGYSACPASAGANCPNTSNTTDTYWADFLFGASRTYSLATYYIAHTTQTMDDYYAQDDWRVTPKLTLNLGLRWEYGGSWEARGSDLSNFNPTTGTMLTLEPASQYPAPATCGTAPCVSTFNGGGLYGRQLVHPPLGDYSPRLGFAAGITPSIALRGGFGTAFVHYWRAGSGNDVAINAPFALFTSVTNPNSVSTPGYYRLSSGFPSGLATVFSAGTDDIDFIPPNTKDGYAESWFLSLQKALAKNILLDIAYVGNHGVHLQGFINANQKNPANGFARPYPNWGGYLLNNPALYPTFSNGDITDALNEFHSSYNALQVRYEQRMVGGLTLLNSFSWQHALDNASSTLDANTPCPQNGDDIEADYGQSDYNLPVSNITTLVYDLPVGQGQRWRSGANGVENAILGGWQISGVNTMQAGTPFNLQYTPAAANAVSPILSQNWRGANAYRPNLVAGTRYVQGNVKNSSGFIQYVNLNSLTLPSTYVDNVAGDGLSSPFGTLPKNYGRTPAFYETDLALNKRFNTPIERAKIEFRSEFYNLFNHTNLYLPGGTGGGTVTGTDGGAVTGGSGGTITTTFEPRIVQFGLKVIY